MSRCNGSHHRPSLLSLVKVRIDMPITYIDPGFYNLQDDYNCLGGEQADKEDNTTLVYIQ